MKEQPKSGGFEKVGECLYRYSSTGGFYARIKTIGKEIRKSLDTNDRYPAKRRLAKLKEDLQIINLSKGRITLAGFCDHYLETVQHLKGKTVMRKELVVRRIKEEWPGGSDLISGSHNSPHPPASMRAVFSSL